MSIVIIQCTATYITVQIAP